MSGTERTENRDRNPAVSQSCLGTVDLFRLFFALCVVAIHTYALDGLPQATAFWVTQGVFRLAVPFFFVVSGFFLGRNISGRGQNPLTALRRYTLRLLGPMLLAEVLNGGLEVISQRLLYQKSLRRLAAEFVRHMLFYPYGAMWFVQACLIGAWLLYPFLKRKKVKAALAAGAVLYVWALLCNSYYFLAQAAGLAGAADRYLERFFSARNGLFVGFFFLALGIQTWEWHSRGRGRADHSRVRRGGKWMWVMAGICLLYGAEILLTRNCAYRDDRALYLTHILLAPVTVLCMAGSRLPIPERAALWMRRASGWLYFSHRFLYGLGKLWGSLGFGTEWRGAGAFAGVLALSGISFGAVLLLRGRRGRALTAGLLLMLCAAALTWLFPALQLRHQRTWQFAAYGASTDSEKTSWEGSFDTGALTIENQGSGKLVPYGADGLSFYYTALDAESDNFVLSAQVTVESWTMTNGEDDGFGLMVCDSVGTDGDSTDFWNNSYMAAVTKVEYCWNPETGKASNVGNPILMRQGIAAREKIGSTDPHPKDAQNAAHGQTVRTYTLEETQGRKGPGTYNIIGNAVPILSTGGREHSPLGTVQESELLTTLRLEICRDNTGYRLRYIQEDGTVHERLFYDIQRENLSAIDPKHIYVGLFVARQARITFQDIQLRVTDAGTDPAAQEFLPEPVEPDFQVTSSRTSNTENYELVFETNWAGTLSVKDEEGESLVKEVPLESRESFSCLCRLQEGDNLFEISFLPESGMAEGNGEEGTVLTNTSQSVFCHKVSWQRIGDREGNIYTVPSVQPAEDTAQSVLNPADTLPAEAAEQTGRSESEAAGRLGTREHPVSLAAAVAYAAPGQRILLAEGEYLLEEPLNIEQGHNGTQEAPIYLMSAPANEGRPVLNFQGKCKGITLSADYWVFDGFDCTGSAVNEYGIHLTGSHNRLENLEIYRNGNTGLHISSRSVWDDISKWPSENLILNCTSYGNCDDAYEDADGFACQFTAGGGNVFDGCTAHHNADDGWDFYAKVWLEPLGPVSLKNCTAYRNGYLEDGQKAGDGNGFKLGGDSMPGGHIVENCLSYENRNDGFTSNSCPDVALIDCTAVDNGKYNLWLYTKNQENTTYLIQGFRSLRSETKSGKSDILEGRGTQKEEGLYSEKNYYWDAEQQAAVNSKGEKISLEEAEDEIKVKGE